MKQSAKQPSRTAAPGRLATALHPLTACPEPDAQGTAPKVSFAVLYSPVARPGFGQKRNSSQRLLVSASNDLQLLRSGKPMIAASDFCWIGWMTHAAKNKDIPLIIFFRSMSFLHKKSEFLIMELWKKPLQNSCSKGEWEDF
ncbi:MAG: hypothetical protein WBF95_00065 [Comamonas thiooxydans]